MSPESEGERDQRIRDAQLESRNRGGGKRSQSNTPLGIKRKAAAKTKNNQSSRSLSSGLPVGVRNVAIGVVIGLIPAILAVILLPGMYKLLAVVILVVEGGASYLLSTR